MDLRIFVEFGLLVSGFIAMQLWSPFLEDAVLVGITKRKSHLRDDRGPYTLHPEKEFSA